MKKLGLQGLPTLRMSGSSQRRGRLNGVASSKRPRWAAEEAPSYKFGISGSKAMPAGWNIARPNEVGPVD